jgi:hypothetical protein
MVSLTGFCFEAPLLSGSELLVSLSPVSLLLTAIPDISFADLEISMELWNVIAGVSGFDDY